jgi:hypothetical protein
VDQTAARKLLTEDGAKQRVPPEAPDLDGPTPAHETVVEQELLHPALV